MLFRHRRNSQVFDLQEAWQSTWSSDWSGRPSAYRSSSTDPESRASVACTGDRAWHRWGGSRWRRSCWLASARPRLDKPTTAPAEGTHFQKAPHRNLDCVNSRLGPPGDRRPETLSRCDLRAQSPHPRFPSQLPKGVKRSRAGSLQLVVKSGVKRSPHPAASSLLSSPFRAGRKPGSVTNDADAGDCNRGAVPPPSNRIVFRS